MPVDADRNDSQLVQAALAGDAFAYRTLVERHGQRVFRFLAKHVTRFDDAEDLAQDTFLQAYRSLSAYRGEAKFSTWLIGIALNVARNHANRSAPAAAGEDDLLEAVAAADDPEQSAQATAKLRAVQRAVACLPAEQRDCVALVFFQGLSYEDAGRILALPTGTVKSRLFRARTRLAAALKDY